MQTSNPAHSHFRQNEEQRDKNYVARRTVIFLAFSRKYKHEINLFRADSASTDHISARFIPSYLTGKEELVKMFSLLSDNLARSSNLCYKSYYKYITRHLPRQDPSHHLLDRLDDVPLHSSQHVPS